MQDGENLGERLGTYTHICRLFQFLLWWVHNLLLPQGWGRSPATLSHTLQIPNQVGLEKRLQISQPRPPPSVSRPSLASPPPPDPLDQYLIPPSF